MAMAIPLQRHGRINGTGGLSFIGSFHSLSLFSRLLMSEVSLDRRVASVARCRSLLSSSQKAKKATKKKIDKRRQITDLELFAAFEQGVVDGLELVGAQVQPFQLFEILELARRQHRVQLIAEQVVRQVDVLQRVLDALQQPFRDQHHSAPRRATSLRSSSSLHRFFHIQRCRLVIRLFLALSKPSGLS